MTEDLRPIDPEELLAHSGWMRALARGLVRDDATAEDLVQQAYAVALERPPRDRGALPAWLKTVVRNLAARSFRDQSRRAKREERVARPESGDGPPLGELLERAELQRKVMEAVLELEEPFRSTVLLRYFEERSPQEVARRLGVPVATVGTRLHRALEKLRDRLDREQGGRAAWVALLAPWIGLTGIGLTGAAAAVATATPAHAASGSTSVGSGAAIAGSAVGSSGSAGGVASGGAATSAGLAWGPIPTTIGKVFVGGAVIMQKPIVASLIAGALCSAIGFGIGRSGSESEVPEGKTLVDQREYTSLVDESSATKERLARIEEDLAALRDEREALVVRAEKAEGELAAIAADAEKEALAAADVEGASTTVVSFGEWGDLPEIRNANWPELAAAVRNINDIVLPLYEDIEAGGTPTAETQQKIGAENNKLVRFGVSIIEKMPSHAPMNVNGEFTHPITLINLIAAMLEEAGLPLTLAQRREVAILGEGYDVAFGQVNATYDDTTWELTKILDEMTLKRDTMFDVEQVLSAQQRSVVAIPEIQNRIRLDTLSPVNMVILAVRVLPLESAAELRSTMIEGWQDVLGIESTSFEGNDDLLAQYELDVAPILEPVSRRTVQFAHLDDIIIAGRAQERLLSDLAARGAVPEDKLEFLANHQVWGVPQVAPSEESAAND